MAKAGFHLQPNPSLSSYTSLSSHTSLLLLHSQNPISHFHHRSNFISNHRFLLRLSSRRLHIPSSRRWDSNAESYNTENFSLDADDEDEDFDDDMEQWAEALEDYIDSIWIFKVFGSYGWMLPLILISLLLANGPKAFLLAMALPIGQSTFAFAIERYQNRNKTKPKAVKNKRKSKKGRSRAYSSRNGKFDEVAEWIGRERPRKKKKEYQSWVYKTDVSDSSSERSSASSFGGWDELDVGMESNVVSSRRAATKKGRSRGTGSQKGKNGRLGKSDRPLFLRLLISIFPFLSSWIGML